MDTIKNIVSEVIGRISSTKGIPCQDIQAAWVKISKDQGSRITDFKDGCVTISANDSLRLVRLNLNRENLLNELQKEIPAITNINFKVGAI